ncbi:MAG TPA: LytTR family DNA-binding domain-containing protein [Phnomibacter sp.]|nr:LytTR family DNA-binding domain-containing protein [Phnomibacter sp.]
MIKAIIIDDEPRGGSVLQQMLRQLCPDIMVAAICNDATSGKAAIEQQQPQLVFLDIVMPEKNALDMLSEMEAISFEVIFVTAYSDYMVKAFRYSAVDYLLKPVDEDLLVEAVDRARKRIEGKDRASPLETLIHNMQQMRGQHLPRVCIHSVKGFTVLEIEDIIYIEAQANYSKFHITGGNTITASKSIVEYDEMLQDDLFFRIHRSYLINMRYVKEYQRGEGGMVQLTNGQWLEVSRRRKDAFLTMIRSTFRS